MEKLKNYTEYCNLTESERQEVDRRTEPWKNWATIGGRSMDQYMNGLKDHICAINNKLNEMDEKKKIQKVVYEKVTTTIDGYPKGNFIFTDNTNTNSNTPVQSKESNEMENLKTQMASLKDDLAVIKELLLKK